MKAAKLHLPGHTTSLTTPENIPLGGIKVKGRQFEVQGRLCKYLHMNADNRACTLAPDSEYVELAVEVFAMLADATRVRLILALRNGELPVNALAEKAGKSAAGVSQHLAKMRLARMVTTRQEGTKVYYRLQDGHAWELVAAAIHQAEHSLGTAPHHRFHPHSGAEAAGQ